MAFSLDRSSRAEQDLIDIWWYIADNNPSQADIFLEKINSLFNDIRQNPNIGRNRTELGIEIKSFPIGNYIVFYKVASHIVTIVRVIHAARDISGDYFQ
jgi:plasmid stabilization system protein ParE